MSDVEPQGFGQVILAATEDVVPDTDDVTEEQIQVALSQNRFGKQWTTWEKEHLLLFFHARSTNPL